MIPKSFGACADRLFKLSEERAALNRKVEKIEEEEKAIKEHLIKNLPKDDSRGVLGKLAKAEIKTKHTPTVKDWDLLYKHILRTKDFSLMQRRVSDAAVKERWEAKKTVPGVDVLTVVKVSITKI